MLAIPVLLFNGKCVIVVPYWADPLALEADRRYMIHGQDNPASSVWTDSSITTRTPFSQRFSCMRIACTLVLQCCSFGVSTFGVTQSKAIRHFDEFSANRTGSEYYFLNKGEAICIVVIRLQWVWSGALSVLYEYSNQRTVSTAERLASLF